MSIKSTNFNSPVGQKKIGLNGNNNGNQMLSPQGQIPDDNGLNNQYSSITQSVPIPQQIQQQQQQSLQPGMIYSSRIGMKPNSPSTLNHFQGPEEYYTKNLNNLQINNLYLQKESLKQSPQYNTELTVNQKSDPAQFSFYHNHQHNKISLNEFNEDQRQELKEAMNYVSVPHNHKQNFEMNERQKFDMIGHSTLQKQKMFMPQADQQYPLQQINLKTYFEQQNLNIPMNSQQPYDSLMRKHQSLAQMSISKRIQLDPIKLSDLTSQPLSTNGSASTKKFLTRKPQTKILNRVFSSKADVKPNKNMFIKNVPQTANSQQTTNAPLFQEFQEEQQIQNQPQYAVSTEPQLQGNGPSPSIYQQYNAKFFASPEKDILNEEIERKQQEKNLYESNIYKQIDSYRNQTKQIEEPNSLQNTLSRGAKVIQQSQRILQQKPNIDTLNQRQQLLMAQSQQQQQLLNFKMSKQNFKPQIQQIPFQ